MILFFHFLCLLAQYLLSNISKSSGKNKVVTIEVLNNDANADDRPISTESKISYANGSVYEGGTLKFFPPVYVQRYETVALILKEFATRGKLHKVVDFGCAELGFFMYLKNLEGVVEILEIDIDVEKLERYSFKAAPLTTDYLMARCTRPLDVYILAGNVSDYDDHLAGSDAVIGIELIEHLEEKTLREMSYNIFHQMKPRLVIFTTPNADFNSLFPNFTDLRHSDHKFEWTRKEFYAWTQGIINQYPEYFVRFYGIGPGPEGTENLGCCTQMAVFQKLEDQEIFNSARDKLDGIHNYKLVAHHKYPMYHDVRTLEEKIIDEIQYQVAHIITLSDFYNYEENEYEIPLTLLKEYVTDHCNSEEELRCLLEKNGMKFKKKDDVWHLLQTDSIYSNDNSFEEEDSFNDNSANENLSKEDYTLETWDLNEDSCRQEETSNFLSARSIEQLKLNEVNDSSEEILAVKDMTKSAPESFNQLLTHFASSSNDDHQNFKIKGISLKGKIPLKNAHSQKLTTKNIEKLLSAGDFI